MLLRIDFESEQPIYQQLRNQVIEGIASGALAPGEALPSVRQLAADIEINMHTANKAYTMLQAEGFITVHKREGFIVRPLEGMKLTPQHQARLEDELRPIIAEAICRGMTQDELVGLCRNIHATIQEGRRIP